MDVQSGWSQFADSSSAAGFVYRGPIAGRKEEAIGLLRRSGVGREKGFDIKLEVTRQLRKTGTTAKSTQGQIDEQVLGAFFPNALPLPPRL